MCIWNFRFFSNSFTISSRKSEEHRAPIFPPPPPSPLPHGLCGTCWMAVLNVTWWDRKNFQKHTFVLYPVFYGNGTKTRSQHFLLVLSAKNCCIYFLFPLFSNKTFKFDKVYARHVEVGDFCESWRKLSPSTCGRGVISTVDLGSRENQGEVVKWLVKWQGGWEIVTAAINSLVPEESRKELNPDYGECKERQRTGRDHSVLRARIHNSYQSVSSFQKCLFAFFLVFHFCSYKLKWCFASYKNIYLSFAKAKMTNSKKESPFAARDVKFISTQLCNFCAPWRQRSGSSFILLIYTTLLIYAMRARNCTKV